MTLEQLGDAVGLTPVDINRCLQELQERGLITRTQRYVAIADWENLTRAGEFDETYLHLAEA